MIEYNASGDHVTSMIVTTMLPTYRACANQSGTGMKARMHAIMASRMAQQDIFRFIHDTVSRAMSRAIEERVDNISNQIIEMCAEIGRQVETVKGEEAQETSRRHPEDLRRIRDTVVTAWEHMLDMHIQAKSARILARNWNWIE